MEHLYRRKIWACGETALIPQESLKHGFGQNDYERGLRGALHAAFA